MIEKVKKDIIHSAEDKILNIERKDIEQYLSEVKDIIPGLTVMDFSQIRQNEHKGFEHEQKYPLTYYFK